MSASSSGLGFVRFGRGVEADDAAAAFLMDPETEPRSELSARCWPRLRKREPDARGKKGRPDGFGVLETRERRDPNDLCERIECSEAFER